MAGNSPNPQDLPQLKVGDPVTAQLLNALLQQAKNQRNSGPGNGAVTGGRSASRPHRNRHIDLEDLLIALVDGTPMSVPFAWKEAELNSTGGVSIKAGGEFGTTAANGNGCFTLDGSAARFSAGKPFLLLKYPNHDGLLVNVGIPLELPAPQYQGMVEQGVANNQDGWDYTPAVETV